MLLYSYRASSTSLNLKSQDSRSQPNIDSTPAVGTHLISDEVAPHCDDHTHVTRIRTFGVSLPGRWVFRSVTCISLCDSSCAQPRFVFPDPTYSRPASTMLNLLPGTRNYNFLSVLVPRILALQQTTQFASTLAIFKHRHRRPAPPPFPSHRSSVRH
jgi:hypothetical protein